MVILKKVDEALGEDDEESEKEEEKDQEEVDDANDDDYEHICMVMYLC